MKAPGELTWLSSEEWARLEPLIPKPTSQSGRTPNHRKVMSAIVHVLRTGISWGDCPASYGHGQYIGNRYKNWLRHEPLRRAFEEIAGKTIARPKDPFEAEVALPQGGVLISSGRLMALLGLDDQTLHYYEGLGFVEPAKDPRGRAFYSDEDVKTILWVRERARVGKTVSEIHDEFIALSDETKALQSYPGFSARIRELERQRMRIDEEIRTLRYRQTRLMNRALLAWLKSEPEA